MTKQEFLLRIRNGLAALPKEDIEKSVEYYREMIDDRMEDGLSEEEAVAAIGSPDEVVLNILAESAQNSRSEQPQSQPKKSSNTGLKVLVVLLIILGSPVWLPLLLAAVIVAIAVFTVFISVIISLYAIVLALGICALALLAMAITGSFAKGLLFLGAALICAGLTVLSFFAVNFIVKFIIFLCKKLFQGIKYLFGRRNLNENR